MSSAVSPPTPTQTIRIGSTTYRFEQIARRYSYEFLRRVVRQEITPAEAAYGQSPSLGALKQAFGFDSAAQIVKVMLTSAIEYFGNNVLTPYQIDELADVIVAEFYYLRLTEIALFIKKMKAGELAKLYGNFAPAYVMECMRLYIAHRRKEMERFDQQQLAIRRQQLRLEREALDARGELLTLTEYIKLKSED